MSWLEPSGQLVGLMRARGRKGHDSGEVEPQRHSTVSEILRELETSPTQDAGSPDLPKTNQVPGLPRWGGIQV